MSSEESKTGESILVDTAVSTMVDEGVLDTEMTEEQRIARISLAIPKSEEPGYSKIDDSFFQHAKP